MSTHSFWKKRKTLVTGGTGFIGSNLIDWMIESRKVNPKNIVIPSRPKDNLLKMEDCLRLTRGIDTVLHLAADVGGLGYSKSKPASQLYNCLTMDLNIVEASRINKVKKVVLMSCSPAYSSQASSPFSEESLLEGRIDDTHLGLGWAKRTMVILAETYRREHNLDVITVVGNNTYGPRDNFDLESAHVIPSIILKCLHKNELTVWGDGTAIRDFIYVKDLVEGILLTCEVPHNEIVINIASGKQTRIKELVNNIVKLTEFKGKVSYDDSKPQGQAQRILDISKAQKIHNFKPQYDLNQGLMETIEWYRNRNEF